MNSIKLVTSILVLCTTQLIVSVQTEPRRRQHGEECRFATFGFARPPNPSGGGGGRYYRRGYIHYHCDRLKYLSCQENQTLSRFVCVCHAGPDPSDGSLCKKPDATQIYEQSCNSLMDCVDTFVCNHQFFPDRCRCPQNKPIIKPDRSDCLGRNYGDYCIPANIDCTPPLECLGSPAKCNCPAVTPNWVPVTLTCLGKFHGVGCANEAECAETLGCTGGTCQCPSSLTPKKLNWNNTTKVCEENGHGGKCTAKDDCLPFLTCVTTNGTCVCPRGQTYDPSISDCTGKPRHGEYCDNDATLERPCSLNLVCERDTSVCQCQEGQLPGPDRVSCTYHAQGPLGASCRTNLECRDAEGLRCINGQCACEPNQGWSTGRCRERTDLFTCDPTEILGVCHELNPWYNWECDPVQRYCKCSASKEWAGWATACKLKAGADCDLLLGGSGATASKVHGLCASQHCILPTETHLGTPGTCACQPVNGLPYIFSSEPGHGCIPNYLGLQCDPTLRNTDCRPTNRYTESRSGLECHPVTQLCQCSSDALKYLNGYCIEASLGPGDVRECNPRFGPTCQLDTGTSLVCEDLGNGTHHCVCLPTVVSSRADGDREVNTALAWDSELLRCDLKGLTEICTAGYECKSQVCTSGRCSSAPMRIGSAGLQIEAVLREVCWTSPNVNILAPPPTFVDRCDKREYLSCQQDQVSSRYICVCHNGPHPTDPNWCRRPDPVQTYGQFCNPLFDCIQPYVCRRTPNIDRCRCPEHMPIYSINLTQCVHRQYGARCYFLPNECEPGLNCVGVPSRCGCPSDRPNWLLGKCLGNLEGEACVSFYDCAATLGCTSNGTCRCPGPDNLKKINWNNQTKECEANGYGERCAAYDDCLPFLTCNLNLTCACPHSHEYNPLIPDCINKPRYGEHCDLVPGIENICEQNLVCILNKCTCQNGQTLHRNRTYCIFSPQSSIGTLCAASVQCRNSEGLNCRRLYCACQQPDRIWSSGQCRDRREIVTCNPQDILGACNEVTPWLNWECDPADSQCKCPGNTEWAAWAQACKLKPGETCELAVIGGTMNMKPTHDLCAGQHCIGPGEESLGRLGSCACAAVNGLPHIYSSEPGHGYVPNYMGQMCDPKLNHVDCRPDTNQYNVSRTGLVCGTTTQHCQCPSSGLKYVNGYCIESNLLPGSDVKCDRRFGPTCQIDPGTGLTCEDSGNGTSSCACLPKVVNSGAGNGTGAQQSWNAQLTRCDLEALEMSCTQGYECKSQICTNGFCSPAPPQQAASTGVEIQAVTFLTFSSILVHHLL